MSARTIGPEAAADLLQVIRRAFGDRPALDPPTDALSETEESLAAQLEPLGGILVHDEHAEHDAPIAGAVLAPVGDAVFLRRVGVVPEARKRGVAHDLVETAAETVLRRRPGTRRLVVLAREELPHTVAFWRDNGFVELERRSPYVELERALPRRYDVATADAMRDLARRIAGLLREGDVLVLNGELGAGKTTFTQGLGEGLGVRGGVTSPTFVIARVHPSLVDGPVLVHVDAYRLGGAAELDDLDLDADLERAVTVVEWGAGLAEALSESPLQITIRRSLAATEIDPEEDPRVVEVLGSGPRWRGVDLPEG